MECDRKQINDLVKRIRAGKPPQLPEGKNEEFYILDGALGSFGSFGIREWLSGTAIGTAWALQSKRHGKQRKKHLGSVHVLDTDQALSAAKDLAAKMQLELLDPIQAKKNAMKAAKVTFESQVPAFLKSNGLRRSTLVTWTRHLTGHYLRPLHKLPLDEITAPQIGTLIDKIEFGGDGRKPSPDVAWQLYWTLNRFFVWAYETGKVGRDFVNPMGQVREPEKGKARDRNLDHDEIRLIWKACEQWEADVLAEEAQVAAGGKRIKAGRASSTDCPRAVRLLFLTGCRPQEIGDMKWSQLDLKAGELTIPAEIYKTGKHTKDIVIPLCDTAIEILRSVQRKPGREYVFGQIGNKGRSDTGVGAGLDLTHARDVIDRRIANVGAPAIDPAAELGVREMLAAGVPTYRIRSEAHVGWQTIKQIQARIEAGLPVAEPAQGRKLPHWQLRDIRRTFSTQLRSVPGVSREIVERLLGHLVGNKTERTYDKHEYWPEKRNAISKWDAYLHAIIDGTVQKIERPKFGLRSA